MTPTKTVVNNTLFCLCDVVESLLLDAERLYKIDNQEFKHRSKADFKATLFHLRRFLSSVRDCSEETQIQFGEYADEYKKLIMLFTDRCNDNSARSEMFMNYMKNCSSILNVDFKKLNIDL